MNQDNNYNVAPTGDNTGIPEVPMAPVQESVTPQVVNQVMIQDSGLVAPVGDNTAIPQVPVATVQENVVNQVVSSEIPVQDNLNIAPVGDNTNGPEVPPAPEQNVQEQNANVLENKVEEQSTTNEPYVVKPNAYNVEAVIVTEEEQLINAYIGDNHNKIVHKLFNWGAFFFGGFYYFYRKMTIVGLLLLLLSVAFIKYFPIGLFILALLCGLVTNKFYVNFVKSRVDKIIKRNMDAGLSTLLLICEKDGGISAGMAFSSMILAGAIYFFFSKYAADVDLKELFNSLKNKGGEVINKLEEGMDKFNEDSILIPIGDRKYEGTMTFEAEPNTTNIFNFNFPEEFSEADSSNIIQYRYLYDNTDSIKCSIEIYQPKGYSTGESVIKQMKNYHAPDNKLKKVHANNINWVTFDYESGVHTYLYGTSVKNDPYIMEFRIYNNEYKIISKEEMHHKYEKRSKRKII